MTECTFISNSHGTFTIMDHILGYKLVELEYGRSALNSVLHLYVEN
jgi:hypothetical protein